MKVGTYLVAQHILATGCTKEEARAAVASACEIAGLDPAEEFGGTSAPATSARLGKVKDLTKLKAALAEGEWHLMPFTPVQFREGDTGKAGSRSPFGYCQGKWGACGESLPDYETSYAYRKKDSAGGSAKVCGACFEAGGGEPVPYAPKGQAAPVAADNEELPF
jgi:hypothetical protein